ncbi:MAG: adenylate kinase [Verrucomicrobia bacterium]|nr:adenylate kinase [Verrucomicrobiota bacterium]
MNIALLGPSGAGKRTQAERLTSQHRLFHLCTGDLFRKNVENKTSLGLQAKSYMDLGEMVPDELVDTMIAQELRSVPAGQGILFDGFPRTVSQANFLEDCFRELGRNLDAVFYLHVSDAKIVIRLSGRFVCHRCQASFHKSTHPFQSCPAARCSGEHLYQRPDDSADMVFARLRHFHRAIGPVLETYEELGKLILIEGEADIDQVGRSLNEALQALEQKNIRSAGGLTLASIGTRSARSAGLRADSASQSFDLVLLGAPGSGKGTQAERLANLFKLVHIATGDLFRENLKQQTPLGQMARAYMDRGELVPDEITDAMVEERLARPDTSRGLILDGFPRNVHQAEALAEMLAEQERRLSGVLYIKVPDGHIIERLSGRLICRNCQAPFHMTFKAPVHEGRCDRCNGPLYQRSDDNPETVRARLKTFHAQTEPVIAFYEKAGLLLTVSGTAEVSAVTRAALSRVEEIMPARFRDNAAVEMAIAAEP